MSFSPEQAALAYLERVTAIDTDGMRDCHAPDSRIWIPGQGWLDREQLIALLSGAKPVLPEGMLFEHVSSIVDGNRVALQMHGDSPLADGRRYVNEYCFVFTFNNAGKIVELREYTDSAPAAAAFAPSAGEH